MKKEIIQIDFDFKMKPNSFEICHQSKHYFGQSEREVFNYLLQDFPNDTFEIKRSYDIDKVKKLVKEHNLFYNPRFSSYLKEEFLN